MKKDSPAEVMPGPLPSTGTALATDPLPSWNDGPSKQSILGFVEKVTTEGSPSFVPVPERIATFDNDGTLWCETPVPVQVYFARDGKPVLMRLPKLSFNNDKADNSRRRFTSRRRKPVGPSSA